MKDLSYSFSPSELSSLLNGKSQRYRIKTSKENRLWAMDNMVLQDKWDGGIAKGTLVERSSEEFRQRPWLHHRNLEAVRDMVTINDKFTVLVSACNGKSLRQLIHEDSFVNNPNCFALKKIYIEDVLWGLDYLHKNNLCLMNVSDANISICEQTNTAIISDFGSLSDKNSEAKFSVPFINQPPEYEVYDAEGFQMEHDNVAAEMWITGMMILEVFTQHKLPWDAVNYEKERTFEMVSKEINEVLKVANFGSTLSLQDLEEFKEFVSLFIDVDPRNRTSARNAASSKFLQSSKNSVSLRKSPRCPSLRFDTPRRKKEFQSSPSIMQKSVDQNKNSKQYRDNFETPKNQPEKCCSSVSFKKCVYPAVKPTNSDFQSSYTRPLDYKKCESKVKLGHNDNSKSNKSLNSEYSQLDYVEASPKTLSKISVSSQTERPTFAFKKCASGKDLKEDSLTGVSPKNSPSGSKMSFSENLHFRATCPIEKKEVPGTTDINQENAYDMGRNVSSNNKPNACETNNSFGKVFAPGHIINNCKSSNDNHLKNCVRSMFDQLNRDGKMPNQYCQHDLTRNTKDSCEKGSKSTVDLTNSSRKFRISVPYDPQEAMKFYNMKASVLQEIKKSQTETKTLKKTPYTLTEKNVSNFQKSNSTARNTPFLMPTTNDSVKNEVTQSNLKDAERGEFNPLKELDDLNKRIKDIKEHMKNISNLKRPSTHTVDHMNSAWKNYSNSVKINEELRNHGFHRGRRCMKHQIAQVVIPLDNVADQTESVQKDNEVDSKHKCQNCADRRIEEAKVPEKSYNFPPPLPHEYLIPTKAYFDINKSPISQPSPWSQVSSKEVPDKDSKKTGCTTHSQVSFTPTERVQKEENGKTKNENGQMKNENGKMKNFVSSGQCHPPKIIVIRGPCRKGRSLVRVELLQTKQKKYAKKKDVAKNPNKSEKNNKASNASTECIIESDSSDEKKQSKKKKALRRCFCIGK